MLKLSFEGYITTIRIEREEKLNAMTPEMSVELDRMVTDINQSDCRVVVLTGGSKVFSAGSDIGSLDQYPTAWDFRNRLYDYPRAIRRIRMPVIAMISGYCLGGGLEMAINADIRYADTSARFGASEVKWGWIGGGGNSQLLPRLIGPGRAAELLLTGRTIQADEALQLGLIDRLFDPADLVEATYALAREIAEKAPITTQVIKQAIRVSQNTGVDLGLQYENELVHITFSTEDKEEGVRAFLEKRKPVFKGR